MIWRDSEKWSAAGRISRDGQSIYERWIEPSDKRRLRNRTYPIGDGLSSPFI